jgi:hypothetical protein
MRSVLCSLLAITTLTVGCAASPGDEVDETEDSMTAVSSDAAEAHYEKALAKANEFGIFGEYRANAVETIDEGLATAYTTVRLELSPEKVCGERHGDPVCGPKYVLEVTYRVVTDEEAAPGDTSDRTRTIRSEGYIGFVHTVLLGNDAVTFHRIQPSPVPVYEKFWIERGPDGEARLTDPNISHAYLPTIAPILSGRPDFWPSTELTLRR